MIPDLSTEELQALGRLIAREMGGVTSSDSESDTALPQRSPVRAGTRFAPLPTTVPFFAIIKVTSAATGGGYYNGTAYGIALSLGTSTTNLSTTKLEGHRLGPAVGVVLNEVGTSNHSLTDAANTSQVYFLGYRIHQSGGTPLYVLIGSAFWAESCA